MVSSNSAGARPTRTRTKSASARGAAVTLRFAGLQQPLADYLASKLELDPDDARVTVEHLLRAEQAGKSSHGLVRIGYTATSGKFGPYGRRPAPEPESMGPGRLRVDGTGHFGYSVLHKLVEVGCREAKRHGLCVARGAFVYPSGCLGDWGRLACREGVGIILMASSPRRVAPPGGSRPVVGTNALCIALPTDPLPFVADCATSEISHGALLVARVSGAPLPPNSAVGPDGKVTTAAADVDPTKGLGALLPFGGSHKAFAIAMSIELIAALGGGVPGEVEAGKHGVFGYFLGPDFLADRMPTLSKWLGHQDASGTRIPGWTSGRRAIEQQDLGIVKVSRKTFDSLAGLGVLSEEDVVVGKRS